MLPLNTLGEDPFLGLSPDFGAALACGSITPVFTWCSLHENLSPNAPLYKDTGHIGLGLTLLQNGLNLIASVITSFPNKVMFRGTAG